MQYKVVMENPTLTIRIPADLKMAVAKAAAADSRSVTSFIVSACLAALEIGPGQVAAQAAEARRKMNGKVKKRRASLQPRRHAQV